MDIMWSNPIWDKIEKEIGPLLTNMETLGLIIFIFILLGGYIWLELKLNATKEQEQKKWAYYDIINDKIVISPHNYLHLIETTSEFDDFEYLGEV